MESMASGPLAPQLCGAGLCLLPCSILGPGEQCPSRWALSLSPSEGFTPNQGVVQGPAEGGRLKTALALGRQEGWALLTGDSPSWGGEL